MCPSPPHCGRANVFWHIYMIHSFNYLTCSWLSTVCYFAWYYLAVTGLKVFSLLMLLNIFQKLNAPSPLISVPWYACKWFFFFFYNVSSPLTWLRFTADIEDNIYILLRFMYCHSWAHIFMNGMNSLSELRNSRGALRNLAAAQPSFSGLQVSTVSSQAPPALWGTHRWQSSASPENKKKTYFSHCFSFSVASVYRINFCRCVFFRNLYWDNEYLQVISKVWFSK